MSKPAILVKINTKNYCNISINSGGTLKPPRPLKASTTDTGERISFDYGLRKIRSALRSELGNLMQKSEVERHPQTSINHFYKMLT